MKNEFLLLAATDMEEAIACAKLRALLREHNELAHYPGEYIHQLTKGLETAICVAYARPFTTSNHQGRHKIDLSHLDGDALEVHATLLNARDSRYAHTDNLTKTGREAGTTIADGKVTGYTEKWHAMNNVFLEAIISIAGKNRDSWRVSGSARKLGTIQ
jgi:hypothetical protein